MFLPAVLLCACFAALSPRPGRPVEVAAGEALVFGRIRVTSPGFPREFLVFSGDPREHLGPDPTFNVELRSLHAPGGAVKYSTAPSPEIAADGSFYWILAHGEYLLASNPHVGWGKGDPEETTVLARFTVPRGAGTVYLGTLQVIVRLDWDNWIEAVTQALTAETPYAILQLSVVDEGESAFTALLSRYPAVPEPRATVPMRSEPP